MNLLCPWESAQLFIFSSNVPTLLYYSHFIAILAALILALFLFGQRKQSLSVKLLLVNITLFISWAAIDVLLWASNRADLVMFYWSLQVLLEVLIYSVSFYFAYVFIRKGDMPFGLKLPLFALLLPALVLVPTGYFLSGIDISYCNAIESNLVVIYSYALEIFMAISILILGIREMHKNSERRKEVVFFVSGIVIFLFAFSSGNIIGSLTEDWTLAQIGLFGMPVFTTFLAYTIMRFNAFNIKLISTQIIVTILWILTLGILFIRKIENVRYIVIFTLILFTVLGYQLIRSVKREVESRERLQKLSDDLQKANVHLKDLDKQKSEFVSFATHQLRSPLTSIRGNTSLILEGDAGPVTAPVKQIVQTIYVSIRTMANIVEDYLNISRIELGTMKYSLVEVDLKDMLKEVMNEQKQNIQARGLSYTVLLDESQTFKVKADPDKFKQVMMNTIDNSVKYTLAGSITVSLAKDPAKGLIRLKIADTGVGIAPSVMPKLFQKFSRAPHASEANIHGTGLGLFIARDIMNAHGGRIWAESEGEGKGSQFYVELPEVR